MQDKAVAGLYSRQMGICEGVMLIEMGKRATERCQRGDKEVRKRVG